METRSPLDTNFDCCATCKYWTGNPEYRCPGTIMVDSNSKGKCTKTYNGGETGAMGNCTNWERRFD